MYRQAAAKTYTRRSMYLDGDETWAVSTGIRSTCEAKMPKEEDGGSQWPETEHE